MEASTGVPGSGGLPEPKAPVSMTPEDHRPRPNALRQALRDAGISPDMTKSDSETASEEDYDQNIRPSLTGKSHSRSPKGMIYRRPSSGIVRSDSGIYITSDDEKKIQKLLKKTSRKPDEVQSRQSRRAGQFRDFVFTRQFSTFDRNNPTVTSSPFRGFYTLLWMGVTLFVFKISADNWRTYGDPLGTKDITRTMFSRDVLVLLLSDGVMCGLTGVTWLIQRVTLGGLIRWDSSGWVLQHIWQVAFIVCVIGWTMIRGWPWTHTVFFVLHGIVMLMKQHSYAFYNGHLSTLYRRRQNLFEELKALEAVDPVNDVSPGTSSLSTSHSVVTRAAPKRRPAATPSHLSRETDIDRISETISLREPLDKKQTNVLEGALKWEIEDLTGELKGTATDMARAYPANLGFLDHYKWIPLPTLVYEIEYPRSTTISWSYVAEKSAAMIGVLFVMIQVSQYAIYPVVMETVAMKERGDLLPDRLREFPWILSNLVFPFMMEYLLVWYLIWEIILNILAELTFFADRRFYDDWWNSVSWDQFARDWNRPVHVFLLRHVYHSSISSLKVNKRTATLITFFLSACIHELVMWCIFKKLRGYLLVLQMAQIPLVKLSQTKWLRGRKTLGNIIFWFGIFTGPSLLCSLYLIL